MLVPISGHKQVDACSHYAQVKLQPRCCVVVRAKEPHRFLLWHIVHSYGAHSGNQIPPRLWPILDCHVVAVCYDYALIHKHKIIALDVGKGDGLSS